MLSQHHQCCTATCEAASETMLPFPCHIPGSASSQANFHDIHADRIGSCSGALDSASGLQAKILLCKERPPDHCTWLRWICPVTSVMQRIALSLNTFAQRCRRLVLPDSANPASTAHLWLCRSLRARNWSSQHTQFLTHSPFVMTQLKES